MEIMQWGIIGCGWIAGKFASSLSILPDGNLLAGASRTAGRAQAFADEHGMERVYSDYESLCADVDVEAIYVATTHNFHYENVKLCLEHGKHVLCEKPLTVNAKQAEELVALAKQNNCFLMEGVWTRFLPIIVKMQELLAAGTIGDVKSVRVDFCAEGQFDASHRMRNKKLAGGALLDLGIYPLSFADVVYDAAPTRIQSSVFIGDTDVDDRSFYLLDYPDGRYAQLASSFTHRSPNEALVQGTKGYIRVPMFWVAEELEVFRSGEAVESISMPYNESEGFKYEIAHVMERIRAGHLESDVIPQSKTLMIMRVMDELRSQWGLVYPEEE